MKKLFSLLIAVTLTFACLAMAGCNFFGESEVDYATKTEYVFSDSGLFLEVMGERGKKFNNAFNDIKAEFEEIDRQTNINREGDSDVLTLNKAKASTEVEIGRYTYEMILKAKEMYQKTNKAFNIASYPLVYLWGIDPLGFEDFRTGEVYSNWRIPQSFADSDIKRTLPLPDYAEIQRVKAMCDLDKLTVTERDGKYYATKAIDGLMIDLGGVSKGYAADLAAQILRDKGVKSAKVDLSGNLAFVGKYHDRLDWNVGISTPNITGQAGIFGALGAGNNATVVTSGDYERFRVVTEITTKMYITHIINTDTGLPYGLEYDGLRYTNIDDRIVSATVMGAISSTEADCLTTAACIMGATEAAHFLSQYGVKAVLITADGKYIMVGGAEFILTDIYDIFKSYESIDAQTVID